MPPVNISLPSPLLTFFAAVAALWTMSSILVVFLTLRTFTLFTREFATKHEAALTKERFDSWLKDSDKRHADYVCEARESRHEIQATVNTLSDDVHVMIGKLDGIRAG